MQDHNHNLSVSGLCSADDRRNFPADQRVLWAPTRRMTCPAMNDNPSSSDDKTGVNPLIAGDNPQIACPVSSAPDLSGITVIRLRPQPALTDYLEALRLAKAEANARLNDPMLLSWYDRDRDFEAPGHVSECHQDSAVPGYVDYGIHHGATLMVNIEDGRFVFFYRPVEF